MAPVTLAPGKILNASSFALTMLCRSMTSPAVSVFCFIKFGYTQFRVHQSNIVCSSKSCHSLFVMPEAWQHPHVNVFKLCGLDDGMKEFERAGDVTDHMVFPDAVFQTLSKVS